ncbi:MAG: hypothetical protein NTZ33_04225 [Bacteroidetes bacterium]|nr:hypothetical protein [Bacteroidota bacterium]
MMLDYIDNINAYGDNVVRLYDFDRLQAVKFRQCLQETIIINNKELDLSSCDFIEGRNCNLILRISEEDEGITTSDDINFYCDLTFKGYEQMIALLALFCTKETKGHQYLYDVDSLTDFLFSPCGTW